MPVFLHARLYWLTGDHPIKRGDQVNKQDCHCTTISHDQAGRLAQGWAVVECTHSEAGPGICGVQLGQGEISGVGQGTVLGTAQASGLSAQDKGKAQRVLYWKLPHLLFILENLSFVSGPHIY